MEIYLSNKRFNTVALMQALLDFDFEKFKEKYCCKNTLRNLRKLRKLFPNVDKDDIRIFEYRIENCNFVDLKLTFDAIELNIDSPYYYMYLLYPVVYFENNIELKDSEENVIRKFFDTFNNEYVIKKFIDLRRNDNVIKWIFWDRRYNILVNPYSFIHPNFKRKIKKWLLQEGKFLIESVENFILSDYSFLKIVSPKDYDFYRNLFEEIKLVRGLA
ncbi:MAG: hypothetical protein QXW35_04410 [Candidatus Aenigmatarchaeota archaeon]